MLYLYKLYNFSKNEYDDDLIFQIKLCNGIILQGGWACDNYEMIVAKICSVKG
jgi:hypothetical protein